MPRKLTDLSGKRFGKLTVTEPAYRDKNGWKWRCKCDCGNETVSYGNNLKHTQSCGCETRRKSSERLATHRKSKSRLFPIWQSMKQRCENPSNHAYHLYGGRGIKVCEEWSNDFTAFEAWAFENGYDENAPKRKCTLDRIDNNGNYEPSNCRWATVSEQQNNKRTNINLTFNGETHTVAEWARRTGLSHSTILGRVKRGWCVEKALTTPMLRHI